VGSPSPTINPEGQRRPTAAMQAHSSQNDSPQQPTKAHEDEKRPKRRQARHLYVFFFLRVFYILTNDFYIIFMFYRCNRMMPCLGDLFSFLHTVCLVSFCINFFW
jgi:hypothetical protein